MDSIPGTMRAALLQDYKGWESIRVTRVPVPQPGPGQVLVRLAFASINPSDLYFINGEYGIKKELPTIPGIEASGTVVAAGSGVMPKLLRGRRVACAAASEAINSGTWGEYLVTDAKFCIPLQKQVTLEQGASMLVNPFTAWALMEMTRRGGHRSFVQTAAASALGRMLIRLGQRFSIETINVVRRKEQVELLRGMGAKHVLNSTDTDFNANLRDLCQQLGTTIGFDAVAGEMSSPLLKAMEQNGRLVVYGSLAQKPCQIEAEELIYGKKKLEGFWLSQWFQNCHFLRLLLATYQIQRLLATDLETKVHERIPLEDIRNGLEKYANNMTAGKILIQL